MINDWLRCPFCGDDSQVYVTGSIEHITVMCGHCDSREKLFHAEHEGWENLHRQRGDR